MFQAARVSSLSTRATHRNFSFRVTPETRQKNFIVAGACACFVTGVWYYSVAAVGGQIGGGGDELEEALREDEIKINVHQSGQLKVDPRSIKNIQPDPSPEGGRDWKFWQKK